MHTIPSFIPALPLQNWHFLDRWSSFQKEIREAQTLNKSEKAATIYFHRKRQTNVSSWEVKLRHFQQVSKRFYVQGSLTFAKTVANDENYRRLHTTSLKTSHTLHHKFSWRATGLLYWSQDHLLPIFSSNTVCTMVKTERRKEIKTSLG